MHASRGTFQSGARTDMSRGPCDESGDWTRPPQPPGLRHAVIVWFLAMCKALVDQEMTQLWFLFGASDEIAL